MVRGSVGGGKKEEIKDRFRRVGRYRPALYAKRGSRRRDEGEKDKSTNTTVTAILRGTAKNKQIKAASSS